jgi:hypothetical protein
LENISWDYDIACKIRRYIVLLESSGNLNDPQMREWVAWAKAKRTGSTQQLREKMNFSENGIIKNADHKKLDRTGYKWW